MSTKEAKNIFTDPIDPVLQHYCLLVIGDNPDKQLKPFGYKVKIAPYKLYIQQEEIEYMMKNYDEQSVHKLIAHMEDWRGYPGGIDEIGLFCETDQNIGAIYEWCTAGGYWEAFFVLSNGYNYQAKKYDIDWIEQWKTICPYGILQNCRVDFQDEHGENWRAKVYVRIKELPLKTLLTIYECVL